MTDLERRRASLLHALRHNLPSIFEAIPLNASCQDFWSEGYLKEAVDLGLFDGPVLSPLRIQWGDSLSIFNVQWWFESRGQAPEKLKAEKDWRKGFSGWSRRLADLIEADIKTDQQPIGPAKKLKRRGPKIKSDLKREAKIYADYKASGSTIKEFANNKGMDFKEASKMLARERARRARRPH